MVTLQQNRIPFHRQKRTIEIEEGGPAHGENYQDSPKLYRELLRGSRECDSLQAESDRIFNEELSQQSTRLGLAEKSDRPVESGNQGVMRLPTGNGRVRAI